MHHMLQGARDSHVDPRAILKPGVLQNTNPLMLCFRLLSMKSSELRPAVSFSPRANSVYGSRGLAFSLMIYKERYPSLSPSTKTLRAFCVYVTLDCHYVEHACMCHQISREILIQENQRQDTEKQTHLEQGNKALRDVAGLLGGQSVGRVSHDEGPNEPGIGVALKVDCAAVEPKLGGGRPLLRRQRLQAVHQLSMRQSLGPQPPEPVSWDVHTTPMWAGEANGSLLTPPIWALLPKLGRSVLMWR